jgi:integrase
MHDKSMTESGLTPRKKRSGIIRVKHGSTVVPIYSGLVHGLPRFTVAFHMNGRRVRRTFSTLEKAKTEAQSVARKIQEGLSATNDLSTAQRECYLAMEKLAAPLNIPLVAAIDEYTRCRTLLGETPLLSVVQDFLNRTQGVKVGAKIPALVAEFIETKRQDKMSERYLQQLAINLRRLATAFPGEVMAVKSGDLDRWIRGLGGAAVTRNAVLRCIKVFFSFAKARGYLPSCEKTAAELVPMARTGQTETEIFQPSSMTKLLEAASADILPLLALGSFAGLRVAEICRLDWSAVDLERKLITLRAGQAKTASRRIVPISDNLHAWLSKIERSGKIIPNLRTPKDTTELAKKLGLPWPHNGMRHSYISYRLAAVKDAAKVALEAGNSPSIIFKHYRELVTEADAVEWFSIAPPDGWEPPQRSKQRYAPRPRRRRPHAGCATNSRSSGQSQQGR